MLRISVKTRLTPEEAVRRAVAFFGPGGYGLELKEQAPACARFEGGGGQVEVVACLEGRETAVELISQEWDYQVREFIDKVAK